MTPEPNLRPWPRAIALAAVMVAAAFGAGVAFAALVYVLSPARAVAGPAPVVSCRFGVVDGDTLKGCGVRVRIWGIQAPERHDPAGPAATRTMAVLVRGRVVQCRPAPSGQRQDRYGRLVAQCFADGRDLAAEMVRQGQAVDWPRYSRGFYAQTGSRGR
jgi:endonuclease YncB( thermonuclease family)